MLIRASGALTQDLFLLTLGASARYLLKHGDDSAILFDPGCSVQLPALLQRLKQISISPAKITAIFITHISAETVAATALLKATYPSITIIGAKSHRAAIDANWQQLLRDDALLCSFRPGAASSSWQAHAPLLFDHYLTDGEAYPVSNDYTVRCIPATGFTEHSCCYLIEPLQAVVADPVGGYFRGRNLPAPAADNSIEACSATLQALQQVEISTLCLPFGGALCGELVPRHLANLHRVLSDVISESVRAHRDGVEKRDIFAQVKQGLFTEELPDPFLQRALANSFAHLRRQLNARLGGAA